MSVTSCATRRVGNRRSRTHAFTLVELLVVIGIIAVLVSMLLPSLARAREQARAVKCLSNLRQLAMATISYCNSNKGVFPGIGGSGGGVNWIAWDRIPLENNPNDPSYIDNSALQPHLGARGDGLKELLRCESDDVNSRFRMPEPKVYRYSYSFNVLLPKPARCQGEPYNYRGPDKPLRIAQVRNSATKIMFVEEDAKTLDDGSWNPFILDMSTTPPTFFNPGKAKDEAMVAFNTNMDPNSMANQVADRHDRIKSPYDARGRGNVAFVDGHAEFFSRVDVGKQMHSDPLYR